MRWILHPADRFHDHGDAWSALNRATLCSPALEPAFVEALLRNFGSGDERLALLEDGGGLRAAAVVKPGRRGSWHSFQPSQATVALWLQDPADSTIDLGGSLLGTLPAPAWHLALTHVDPGLLERPAPGARHLTLDYIPTPRLAATGSFDDYWATRGKNLRRNVRRQFARLEKDGVKVETKAYRTAAEIRDGVRCYSELESAGWKKELGTAVTPGGAQHRFYEELLTRFAEDGERGFVFVLRYDDEPVAVDLCVKAHGTCIVLKTTYDERISVTSPALLLRHEYFQQLFAMDDVQTIEFYGRVMEWHTKWTDDIRTMYHLNLYRSALLRKVHALVRRWRDGEEAAHGNVPETRGEAEAARGGPAG